MPIGDSVWRMTFGWDGENVTGVDMEDYH